MKRSPLKRKTPMRRTPMVRRRKPQTAEDRASNAHAHRTGAVCAIGRGIGCDGPLELHHVAGRRDSIRNHPLNLMTLCAWHHRHSRILSPHGAPAAFRQWLEAALPDVAEFVRLSRRTSAS